MTIIDSIDIVTVAIRGWIIPRIIRAVAGLRRATRKGFVCGGIGTSSGVGTLLVGHRHHIGVVRLGHGQ